MSDIDVAVNTKLTLFSDCMYMMYPAIISNITEKMRNTNSLQQGMYTHDTCHILNILPLVLILACYHDCHC